MSKRNAPTRENFDGGLDAADADDVVMREEIRDDELAHNNPAARDATTVVASADPTAADAAEAGMPAIQRRVGMGWLFIVSAIIGFLASGKLVLEELQLLRDPNFTTSCDLNPLLSCSTVMKSDQAHLFGFPNPLIGIVAFGIVMAIGVALVSGSQFSRGYWLATNVGVLLGFIFCVWLWYEAVYEIGALCIYCMVVWTVMIFLTVHLTVRNISHGVIPASPRAAAIAQDIAWPAVAVLIIGVMISIFIRFAGVFVG